MREERRKRKRKKRERKEKKRKEKKRKEKKRKEKRKKSKTKKEKRVKKKKKKETSCFNMTNITRQLTVSNRSTHRMGSELRGSRSKWCAILEGRALLVILVLILKLVCMNVGGIVVGEDIFCGSGEVFGGLV